MTNLQQIEQVAAQLHLNLDNSQSVHQQLKRINESHTKRREFKQQFNVKLKETKQSDNGFGLDEAASIGLHLFGKHRIAREVRQQGNIVERQQRRQQKNARQPYIKMKDLIDKYIFEADRLRSMAQKYLQKQKR